LEEECLQGRELVALYGKRCKQCAEEWPSIDPRPVSETGQQLLEGIVAAVPPPPNNTELTLTQLSKSLTDLTGKLTKIRTIMLWGFAIMIVLTLFRYHV